MAQYEFDQVVELGILPISEAFRILNDKKGMKRLLDAAEKSYLASEHGKLTQIHKNTSFKSAMIAGIASGAVICLFSPFVNELLQPTAKEILGRAPKQSDEPKPAQQQSPAPSNTTINNYYYYQNEKTPAATPLTKSG